MLFVISTVDMGISKLLSSGCSSHHWFKLLSSGCSSHHWLYGCLSWVQISLLLMFHMIKD